MNYVDICWSYSSVFFIKIRNIYNYILIILSIIILHSKIHYEFWTVHSISIEPNTGESIQPPQPLVYQQKETHWVNLFLLKSDQYSSRCKNNYCHKIPISDQIVL